MARARAIHMQKRESCAIRESMRNINVWQLNLSTHIIEHFLSDNICIFPVTGNVCSISLQKVRNYEIRSRYADLPPCPRFSLIWVNTTYLLVIDRRS